MMNGHLKALTVELDNSEAGPFGIIQSCRPAVVKELLRRLDLSDGEVEALWDAGLDADARLANNETLVEIQLAITRWEEEQLEAQERSLGQGEKGATEDQVAAGNAAVDVFTTKIAQWGKIAEELTRRSSTNTDGSMSELDDNGPEHSDNADVVDDTENVGEDGQDLAAAAAGVDGAGEDGQDLAAAAAVVEGAGRPPGSTNKQHFPDDELQAQLDEVVVVRAKMWQDVFKGQDASKLLDGAKFAKASLVIADPWWKGTKGGSKKVHDDEPYYTQEYVQDMLATMQPFCLPTGVFIYMGYYQEIAKLITFFCSERGKKWLKKKGWGKCNSSSLTVVYDANVTFKGAELVKSRFEIMVIFGKTFHNNANKNPYLERCSVKNYYTGWPKAKTPSKAFRKLSGATDVITGYMYS
jgi:hypothetical protein